MKEFSTVRASSHRRESSFKQVYKLYGHIRTEQEVIYFEWKKLDRGWHQFHIAKAAYSRQDFPLQKTHDLLPYNINDHARITVCITLWEAAYNACAKSRKWYHEHREASQQLDITPAKDWGQQTNLPSMLNMLQPNIYPPKIRVLVFDPARNRVRNWIYPDIFQKIEDRTTSSLRSTGLFRLPTRLEGRSWKGLARRKRGMLPAMWSRDLMKTMFWSRFSLLLRLLLCICESNALISMILNCADFFEAEFLAKVRMLPLWIAWGSPNNQGQLSVLAMCQSGYYAEITWYLLCEYSGRNLDVLWSSF